MTNRVKNASSGIRFSAEKPRRLQQSTGLLLRAAFRIPDEKGKIKNPPRQMAVRILGASSGIRTPDTLLKRQVLCRLS